MGHRAAIAAAGVALLCLALLRIPSSAGQSAVPLSRPGQEDLTFWVNHNGLDQIEVLGEVGFGDMARILMRRRANGEAFRKLRDRFTFSVKEMSAIQTPDVFRVDLTPAGLEWRNEPTRFVIAAGRTFNLPLIVTNSTNAPVKVGATFTGTEAESRLTASDLGAGSTAGYFLR